MSLLVRCFTLFIPLSFWSPVFVFAAPLPHEALQEGTLANQQLIHDTKVGVAAKVATLGCSKPEKLQFFVMALPEGVVGARVWKEQWIISGCGKKYPVNIEFSEDGQDAANWTIR